MPEGPSIVILKEALQPFKGKKITLASGNAKIDMDAISSATIKDFKSWGKQFFIILKDHAIRIHLLMFGSYSINEQTKPDRSLRLRLEFEKGAIYFYTCSVRLVELSFLESYDWSADVMSDDWNAAAAKKKLKAKPEMLVCDALLDQDIFSGSGNIIKNEVMFRIRVHPLSRVGQLPPKKLKQLIDETRNYSFDFYNWKKQFVLRKHWLMHTKKKCTACGGAILLQHLGNTNRRTFYCEHCQKLY